ncbi:MAG: type VI secretion system-associated protein TagF [Planctomycetota bacterium]
MSTHFPVCAFGKLPVYREFIQQDARYEAVDLLEGWFNDGITDAARELGDRWALSFDERPPVRFFYIPPGGARLLAGVIRPSFDAVGRRYPFAIAAVAEQQYFDGDSVMLLPAVFGNFLTAISRLSGTLVSPDVDLKQLLSRISSLKVMMDPPSLQAWLHNYLTQQTSPIFWSRQLGRGDDPRRFAVLHNLSESLRGTGSSGCALRLPPARDAGDVGFWCVVSWLLTRRKTYPMLVLWDSPDSADPDGLTLVFGSGKLASSAFRAFFCNPPGAAPGVRDVVHHRADDEAFIATARSRFADILDDGGLTPSDWLQRLSVRNLV